MPSPAGMGRIASLVARALVAEAEATVRSLPGHRFGVFGRALGARLMASGATRTGASLLLSPVSSVRYWEFDFADRHLRPNGKMALDVSSPRLLALYLAHRRRYEHVTMANPDADDLVVTDAILRASGEKRVVTLQTEAIQASGSRAWDAVWSISVVEHIGGDAGDSEAVGAMYRALRPGGMLVITVPVDRQHWEEYRGHDAYGHGADLGAHGYFFQRYYDMASIEDRLVKAIGAEPVATEWFGEIERGVFAKYERRWIERGLSEAVSDPSFIARHFRTFASWEDMPGMGVCGLAFRIPAGGAS